MNFCITLHSESHIKFLFLVTIFVDFLEFSL